MRRLAERSEKFRNRQFEALAGPQAEEVAAQIPGRQGDGEADQHQKAYISPQQFARGDRAWVGWQGKRA